jgi:hypothetical protein
MSDGWYEEVCSERGGMYRIRILEGDSGNITSLPNPLGTLVTHVRSCLCQEISIVRL